MLGGRIMTYTKEQILRIYNKKEKSLYELGLICESCKWGDGEDETCTCPDYEDCVKDHSLSQFNIKPTIK